MKKLKAWGFPVDRMFLAAGPCSAESREQVLECASALKDRGVSFFRAGVWKPRTRPGSFEGVGLKGLAWLDEVRAQTGLKVGTEVAEPAHVEACLEYGLDVLWIGARTSTNPFSVQAIADVLRGTDIPVLVKNPMSADVGLWIGAIERIANAGITKVGAIHRGFSSEFEMRYRNAPGWKTPIELKRRLPELPIICDPSHICGKRELIASVAQEALDLLFAGLMVEVHPHPENALSDSEQQLTPTSFTEMIQALNLPSEQIPGAQLTRRVHDLRERVDRLDCQLLDVLAKRMDIVRKLGEIKAEKNISTFQPNRWQTIVQDRIQKGVGLDLSENFVLHLMQSIHEESIRQQELHRTTDDLR